MRILFVIPYYIPAYSYGGPMKVAHDLAQELVKRGHQVTVATTDAYDAKARNPLLSEEIDGVKIIRFRNLSNYLAKFFNGYLPLGFRKWLKTNLKNYDLVHCHDFFTYQNILISKYCQKFNVPYIVEPHGVIEISHIKSKNAFLKKFILKRFKRILEHAKNIIALTQAEKESILYILKYSEYLKQDDKKIIVIPNGIKLNEFKNVQRIDLHKKYNLSSETKLLFYFGRVQYIKGIDYVLKTLSLLVPLEKEDIGGLKPQKDQNPQRSKPTLSFNKLRTDFVKGGENVFSFHFFIIGPDEGGEQARLTKLINAYNLQNQVTFVGQLEGEAKKQFIASCDLFLFFSRGEGLPMTVLEVSALGIPSILSRECNVPEIAQGEGGYEVAKENFEQNAQIIRQHFEKQTKIEQMKINTKKIVEEKFAFEASASKIFTLY